MKKFLIVLSVFLICFTSCTSIDMFSQTDNLPSWTSSPRIRKGKIGYVSKGKGKTVDEASSDAGRNMLKEMSQDLGWDAYSIYFRELRETGAISDFKGKVDKTYSRQKDGEWTEWMLFIADEETFSSLRTIERKEYFEREERIESAVEEAAVAYRENRDVDALEQVLDALLLSLEGPTDGFKYDSDDLLELALRYLEPLEIRIEQVGESADSEIRVIRNKGLFSPKVKNAPVVFHYERTTTKEETLSDSVETKTGPEGTYRFKNTDPYIRRTGKIAVSISLDHERLYRIEELSGQEFFAPFRSMLEKKTMSYDYDLRKRVGVAEGLDAVMVEYGISGREVEGPAAESFRTSFADDGVTIPVYRGHGEGDEEILLSYLKDNPDHGRYVAVMRIGIVEDAAVLGRMTSRTEGSFRIMDTTTMKLVLFDDSMQSIGYGETTELSRENALRNAGRIMADILRISML